MRKQDGNNTYIDHILDQVEKEKDLGVTVDCNLSFEHHIMEKVSKANHFTRLYKTIVRPHLEYANSVWMSKRTLERRSTKLVQRLRDLNYPDSLNN